MPALFLGAGCAGPPCSLKAAHGSSLACMTCESWLMPASWLMECEVQFTILVILGFQLPFTLQPFPVVTLTHLLILSMRHAATLPPMDESITHLVLTTAHGRIRIELKPEWSKPSVDFVRRLAQVGCACVVWVGQLQIHTRRRLACTGGVPCT